MNHGVGSTEVLKLLATKRDIEECLRLHQEDLKLLRASRVVSVQDLLKESLQIQYNCHAPNGYTIGMPLFKSHPPAPQPEEMRVGALSTYNNTPVGRFGRDEGLGSAAPSALTSAVSLLEDLRKSMTLKRDRQLADPAHREDNEISTQAAPMDEEDNSGQSVEVDNSIALKKARTVNISFGMSDSEESDGD